MRMRKNTAVKVLKVVRLCLGGAVLGTAIAGWLAPHMAALLGMHVEAAQAVGAAGGTLASALLLKVANIPV